MNETLPNKNQNLPKHGSIVTCRGLGGLWVYDYGHPRGIPKCRIYKKEGGRTIALTVLKQDVKLWV
jgi:hypothetical protein